jgi:hypothetical protein
MMLVMAVQVPKVRALRAVTGLVDSREEERRVEEGTPEGLEGTVPE